MVNSFGDTYNTGLLSVANGSTTVTITGALMTTQAVAGDLILLQGVLMYVSTVTADETVEISHPWTGTSVVNSAYLLLKESKSRYDPAITQVKQRQLLAYYEAIGFFYFVEDAEPDEGMGEDGQWALKVTDGSWQLWYKVAGVWEAQGVPIGVDFATPFAYDDATSYAIGKVVGFQGKWWRSRVTSNVGNQPDISPTEWEEILSGGDRYDSLSFDTDRPSSDELLDKWLAPSETTFYSGLSESTAHAEVGATDTAIYRYYKNGVLFATLTFSAEGQAGPQYGVFSCPSTTVFAFNDVFTLKAPLVRDATLSGVCSTIVAYRV